jgi:enoyl-CoA hydratase/carnithine racemase
MGIVHEVAADPLARALEIGAELSSRGAEGLAFAKRLTRAALDHPLADGLADERKSFGTVMRTASAREALRAARPPIEIQKL